jgi:hypothetical protein
MNNTGYTQKNGAVLIVFTIKTAPFFCVFPVYNCLIGLDVGRKLNDVSIIVVVKTQRDICSEEHNVRM